MTSLRADISAPDFLPEAASLLGEVNEATAVLAVDAGIPHQVGVLVKELGNRLHAADPNLGLAAVDPTVRAELLGSALLCHEALDRGSRRDLRVCLEQVRHLLRDIVEERDVQADRDPRAIARWLVDTVAVPQPQIATVLGVAPRTLQRWVSASGTSAPSGEELARLSMVAAAVAHLRHSFTGPGALRWFDRPHPALDGHAPLELLDDPANYPMLRSLAARARSMVAS